MARIIDSCCLINLFAAGEVSEILLASGGQWHAHEKVFTESRYTRRSDPGDPDRIIRVEIDFQPILASGTLLECIATEEELALFVGLVGSLDDGEAICLAVAQNRGWTLATDDLAARRLALERGVTLLSTGEVLKRWLTSSAASPFEIAAVLRQVERFARFRPGPLAPETAWWAEVLTDPE